MPLLLTHIVEVCVQPLGTYKEGTLGRLGMGQ